LSTEDARGGYRAGVVVGFATGLVVTVLGAFAISFIADDGEDDPVAEARQVIEASYFEEVGGEELDEASIRGMVDELRKRYDDRFSHYFDPKQFEEFQNATSGEFSGVGLTVTEVPRGLRVAAVIPDTPAERAGLGEGDLIVGVDGSSLEGVPADVSTARIKGPPGTEVELRVVAADAGRARTVTLERAAVRVPAVRGRIVRDGGRRFAYVAYHTFSEGSHGELRDTIERLFREGAEGLVLDLRGNGGGLLNEAVLSSSAFVEDGVIVSTRSRSQGARDYEAVGEALDPRPTVVLVNRDTASAAEILTAALEVNDLATVVGERTFGKGTFQEVIGLPSGGGLDLTIGQYLTADGTSLAGTGIPPDVRAVDDPKTKHTDEGMRRGLEVLGDELGADNGS
jgi:carboxyl-terminal processing protease